MAVLHNESRTLRLAVELVDREVPPVIPGQPPVGGDAIRVLGSAGMEFYDRRDSSYWPIIRLPVVYYEGTDPAQLVGSIRDLCSLKIPGFAFRTGSSQELAIQVGGQDGRWIVEVGLDLATFVLETAGTPGEAGRELAMFRFVTTTAELVRFADELKQEIGRLPPPKSAGSST
jgi:hypothetical protein